MGVGGVGGAGGKRKTSEAWADLHSESSAESSLELIWRRLPQAPCLVRTESKRTVALR